MSESSWARLMSEQSVPVSDAPLSRSELQKLDDGVFISEIRKAQAGVVARTRESADRAWKVAATIAAVVLATGFTTSLTDASEFVQVTGVCSIVAWLVAVGMFIRVNTVPPDDSAEWVPISEGVNRVRETTDVGVLLITHYTRILRYIKPDFVHVMVKGRIAEEGVPELAERLENEGYDRYLEPSDVIEA